MKTDKYITYLEHWYDSLKLKLYDENYKDYKLDLYVLNKEFFSSKQRNRKFNQYIIKSYREKYIVDEEKEFFILNKNIWNKIRYDFPNEMELKVRATIVQNKCFIKINEYIYYFYFINKDNEFEEGYFQFQDHIYGSNIISLFIELDIYEFFKKMKIRDSNEIQKIYYEDQYFFIKRKRKFHSQNDFKNNINENINKNNKKINNQIENNNNFGNSNNDKKDKLTNNSINNIQNNNKNNIDHNIMNTNNMINNNINNKNKIKININNAKNNLFNQTNNNFKKIGNNNMNNINDIRSNQNNNINRNNSPFLNNHIKDFNNINQNNKKRTKSANNININRFISPSTKGLVNVGTNYMNVTIQCLAHVQKLTIYLFNKKNAIEMDKNKYKLTNSYIEVLNNIWLNYNINNYSPDNFKNSISEINPLIIKNKKYDSKVLFLFILTTMHNELNKPNNNNQMNEIGIQNQYDYETTFTIFTFCKSFVDNQWYKYNDTQVNLSSFQEARSTGVPYILFYSYIKR